MSSPGPSQPPDIGKPPDIFGDPDALNMLIDCIIVAVTSERRLGSDLQAVMGMTGDDLRAELHRLILEIAHRVHTWPPGILWWIDQLQNPPALPEDLDLNLASLRIN